MQNDRIVFRGKPKQYYNHIKQALLNCRSCIENIHFAAGQLKMKEKPNGEVTILLGKKDIIKPGSKIDVSQYPLQFRDGSVLAISQRPCK